MVADAGTFETWDNDLKTENPLNFPEYEEKVAATQEKTGLYLKKFASLSSEKDKAKTSEKVIVIDELRHEFKLEALLKYAEVTRSTFYYQLNRMKEPDKYKEIKETNNTTISKKYVLYTRKENGKKNC